MIRHARDEDMAAALSVMAEAFGVPVQVPSVHTLVAGAPDGTLLVAERDGRVIGTGGSVGFGPTGWLGGITVSAEARGAGLGRALTEASLAALGERDTVLLLASHAGQPIYERLGFAAEGRYRVFSSPAGAAGAAVDGVREAVAADRDAILALDAEITGERRTLALDASLDGALVTEDLSGVALRPPWPARPILARDAAAGAALLAASLLPGARLAVPEANAAAVAALQAYGATERPGVLRMRRGPAVAWRPEGVWGVFSLFFG